MDLENYKFTRSFSLPISLLEEIKSICKRIDSNPNKACEEAFRLWVEKNKSAKAG